MRQMTKLEGATQWSGGYGCPAAIFSVSRTRCSAERCAAEPGPTVAGRASRIGPGSAVRHHSASKTHVNVLVVSHCVRGMRDRTRGKLDHAFTVSALLLFRALPDHAGIA